MKSIIKKTRWLESKAGPYGSRFFLTPAIDRIFGVLIILFTATAFVAPPFSGLDTLPAIGVVLISLAVLLDNVFVLLAGVLIGTAGMILSFFFATVAVEIVRRVF